MQLWATLCYCLPMATTTCARFEGEDCPEIAVATLTWGGGSVAVCESHWAAELADLNLSWCEPVLTFH